MKFRGLLVLQLETGYQLSEEINVARADSIISEIGHDEDVVARYPSCFRCRMIRHFVRYCIAITVNTTDDVAHSAVVGKMQTILTADSDGGLT